MDGLAVVVALLVVLVAFVIALGWLVLVIRNR